MKAMMGFLFFLLFLAGIALVMLMGRQLSPPGMAGGGASLTGKEWRLTVLGTDTMPSDSEIFISFDVDGSIKGHAGCNRIFGALEKSDAGIKFGSIGSTRMACDGDIMQRESDFIQILEKTRNFESQDDRLKLLDDNRVVLAEFRAADN